MLLEEVVRRVSSKEEEEKTQPLKNKLVVEGIKTELFKKDDTRTRKLRNHGGKMQVEGSMSNDEVNQHHHTSKSTCDEGMSNTSSAPIRRRRRGEGHINCRTCSMTFRSKDRLEQHMKNKHHRELPPATKRYLKGESIKKICDMCQDEISTNGVDARITLIRAKSNVDNAKRSVTDLYTTFEAAQENLISAESRFQAAQTNVITHRQDFDTIREILKDAQKVVAESELTLVGVQRCLRDAENCIQIVNENTTM